MKSAIKKINFNGILKLIRRALASKFFPFVTAAVNVFCYYLGLDLVIIYYTAIVGTLILILCDDLSPLISLFLFMNIMVTKQHSPSYLTGGSDYYFQTAVLAQVIVCISSLVIAVFYRIVKLCLERKFKATPVFYGLCALAIALIANGMFSENYKPTDLMYGAFMAFFFLGIFVLLKDNIKPCKELYERIALGFMALSAVLILELIVTYATTENIFVNGVVNRALIAFGWGMYNTYGMLIVLCIPAALFLAAKLKHGYLFTVYSFVLVVAAVMCMSRQSMLTAAVIFILCIIILLVKGKYRLQNLIICGVALAALIVILGIFHDKVGEYLKNVFANIEVDGELNGSSRTILWRTAFRNFISAPIFGTGFYVFLPQAAPMVGLDIIPLMYHNTFMQLLASCGIVGLLAYVVHRIQTVISFMKKITFERTYVAITLLALLIISIVDNHMFYILPTLVYSSLLSVLVRSEKD